MRKKILLALFLCFFYISIALAENFKLELTYPFLEGTEVSLPNYVNYIFKFSIIVIGFIIFGTLIYAGIKYITSFGDPGKYNEAKKGILSAFLGGAILLSAFLIFQTINPNLSDLTADQLPTIGTSLSPGLYICQKKDVTDAGVSEGTLNAVIRNYATKSQDILRKNNEIQEKETEEERKILYSERTNLISQQTESKDKILDFAHTNNCKKIDNSIPGIAGTLGFPVTNNNLIFAIPKISDTSISFPYGLIIHSENTFKGQCRIITHEKFENSFVLQDYQGYNNSIRSVTIYEKTNFQGTEKVTLYDQINHNGNAKSVTAFPKIEEPLSNIDLDQNLRSIKIDGNAIAIISTWLRRGTNSTDNFANCGVINRNSYRLSAHPAIGTLICRRGIGSLTEGEHDVLVDQDVKDKPCATHYSVLLGIIL
ncbi:MAG: pilin [Candidatus Pacebacteria bacterium]|nr:pilin [Candidatus Paceibacterota bacterium]